MLGHVDASERVHRAPFLVHREVAERSPHERHAAEQAEADVGEHREPRHQIELLKDDADPDAQVLGAADDPAVALDGPAEHDDRTGAISSVAGRCLLDRDQPRQCANERRFSGSGRSDQRHHFARADRECHIVKHARAALERFRDAPNVDKGLRLQAISPADSDLSAGYDSGMNAGGAGRFPPVRCRRCVSTERDCAIHTRATASASACSHNAKPGCRRVLARQDELGDRERIGFRRLGRRQPAQAR